MTDEDLIARLREIQGQAGLFASAAADRIEALVRDKRWIMEERDRTFAMMLTRAEVAEARAERLEAALKIETEEKLDAISTLDAWFDRRKLGHEAVDQAVVDAASGYLRTSRVGGMEQEESDLILGVIQDMARLGLFADLFARAALGLVDGGDCLWLVETFKFKLLNGDFNAAGEAP